jgi:small subunit ribosomal protein S7
MRSKQAPLREITPDPKYGSPKISKFINYVMRDGKKAIAAKIVYTALDAVAKETKKKPTEIFDEIIDIIAPHMEVRSRRVGGAAYQVPMPVKGKRAFALALSWLIAAAAKRSNKEYHTFAQKLAAEMLDALKGVGGAIDRRDSAHKAAEANKAFAHFRW